jgi:hypothetical protein
MIREYGFEDAAQVQSRPNVPAVEQCFARETRANSTFGSAAPAASAPVLARKRRLLMELRGCCMLSPLKFGTHHQKRQSLPAGHGPAECGQGFRSRVTAQAGCGEGLRIDTALTEFRHSRCP